MDDIKSMINQLSSSEWRVRYDAITTFQEMCVEQPDAVAMNIVKVRGVGGGGWGGVVESDVGGGRWRGVERERHCALYK